MEASQNEQLELRTLTERVTDEIDAVYGRHGYLIEGEPNRRAVEDKVYDLVVAAVVEKRADRGRLAVSRRNLVKAAFPQVPGPESWAEADDPELAEGVYKRLDSAIWRLVDDNAAGKIQARLNGNSDLGLILCRTKATPDKADAVYVTSDLQCLLQDFTKPQKERIDKEVLRMTANLTMAVDRRPEYAAQFKRELNNGVKAALGRGNAILVPAIEAATAGSDDDVDVDDDE